MQHAGPSQPSRPLNPPTFFLQETCMTSLSLKLSHVTTLVKCATVGGLKTPMNGLWTTVVYLSRIALPPMMEALSSK